MTFHLRSTAARRSERAAWQQVSLAAGFLAGRHFIGTSDLHYGYWLDGLAPEPRNLPRAQDAYSTFLLDHIPAQARRILDVGSGAGGIASKLVDRGHEVDCVSPSALLNQEARMLLGDRANILETTYEDFETRELYDVILFCESFQYVDMRKGLPRICSQLRSGGALVICDYFRLPVGEESPIGGGHSLDEFQRLAGEFPLRLVEDKDITARTAPTYTVIHDAYTQVLQPISDEVGRALAMTYPIWSRFAGTIFGSRMAKVKRRFFSQRQTANAFQKFKTYRLFRFERY